MKTAVLFFGIVITSCASATPLPVHVPVPDSSPASASASASASAPAPASASASASACARTVPTACASPRPSYAADIRPLLERRCYACHANGGEAADDHDFSRLATLRAQQRSVIAEVGACAMPPQGAHPLEDDEAALLLRWIACGTPD